MSTDVWLAKIWIRKDLDPVWSLAEEAIQNIPDENAAILFEDNCYDRLNSPTDKWPDLGRAEAMAWLNLVKEYITDNAYNHSTYTGTTEVGPYHVYYSIEVNEDSEFGQAVHLLDEYTDALYNAGFYQE